MTMLFGLAAEEVRRRLRSPASWLIVGVFALLAGAAFVFLLNAFLDASLQALSAPPARPVNVNQLLIRPFIVQVGLAALLVLPFLTAPTGTRRREPASADRLPRVAAPFIGVMAVYGVMLVATLFMILPLYFYGGPEWAPIASGYLGLFLVGAAFVAAALFIASLSTAAEPAVAATLALALALVAASWLAASGVPAARALFQRISVAASLDDFSRGVIDAGHVVTCVTIAAVALFLATHTVQDQRSR